MNNLEEIFVGVDDFCQKHELAWEKNRLQSGKGKRTKSCKISISEIMTIVILFHQSGFRNIKEFYKHVCKHLKKEFPNSPSYSWFVRLTQRVFIPLCHFLFACCRGQQTGIHFIDSTKIVLSHNKRISRHKVFKKIAQVGKSTMGWFYGLKLHLIVNDKGELMNFCLSAGNANDRKFLNKLASKIT